MPSECSIIILTQSSGVWLSWLRTRLAIDRIRCRRWIEPLSKHYFFELLILGIYMVIWLRMAASILSLIVGIENLSLSIQKAG